MVNRTKHGRNSVFRIPHSAFRIPYSAFRIPKFRILKSVCRIVAALIRHTLPAAVGQADNGFYPPDGAA